LHHSRSVFWKYPLTSFWKLAGREPVPGSYRNLVTEVRLSFFCQCDKLTAISLNILSLPNHPAGKWGIVINGSIFSLRQRVKRKVVEVRIRHGISRAARAELRRESTASSQEVSVDLAIREALAWLGRAQDNSRSADGGVARHYCLVTGWGESYPETTGYIVPTLILEARISGDGNLLARAQRMLNWLVGIQMSSGAFQGGAIGELPVVPVTFNTGQSLMGLAAGVSEFGEVYHNAMVAAADWLVATQDSDGCFAAPGEKVYESHVAWGLLEAARLEPSRGYAEAAMRNIHWVLSHQNNGGWFANCCLSDPVNPLTHTLGYALRGLIAGYEFTGDVKILREACRTAEGALTALRPNGFLPGFMGMPDGYGADGSVLAPVISRDRGCAIPQGRPDRQPLCTLDHAPGRSAGDPGGDQGQLPGFGGVHAVAISQLGMQVLHRCPPSGEKDSRGGE
jgi:hypothetical protein